MIPLHEVHRNLICVFGTFVRYSYNMIPVCCLLHLFFFNVNRPPNLALVPSSPKPCNLVVAAVPKPTKSIIFALDYVWPMSTCMYPRLFNLSRFTCISLYICSILFIHISRYFYLKWSKSCLIKSCPVYPSILWSSCFLSCLSKFLLLPIRRVLPPHWRAYSTPSYPIHSSWYASLTDCFLTFSIFALRYLIFFYLLSSNLCLSHSRFSCLAFSCLIWSEVILPWLILSDLIVFPFTLAGLFHPKR